MHANETEIVFLASTAQLDGLPAALRTLAATVRTRPLCAAHDQYLDTPGRRLAKAGVTCRFRRTAKRATLTLKSRTPFDGGFADRAELSEELPPGVRTWPGPLPAGELRKRLLPLMRGNPVRCLFQLNQSRRVYEIGTRDGARLEVSADRTRLAVPDRGEVLRRIEVELRDGPVEALIRFGAELRRRLGLEPAAESKFEYGLRAAGLSAPVPGKDPALSIQPRDSLRKAAGRALRRHYSRMLWQVPGARLGINPDCIHDLRVSVRRLRAVLRLFRDALPKRLAADVRANLKWLGQSLGAVRDLDVHLQQASSLRVRRPEASCEDVEICRDRMRRRRERAYETMSRDLRSPRFRLLIRTLQELIGRLSRPAAVAGGPVEETGAALMRAELKKIRRAGRAITAKSPDEALHRLRVRCKRLRYACETLGDVYGKPVAKMARRLAALQDVLGAHQDAVAALALIDIVRTEAAAAEPAEAAVAAALGRCDGDWRRERLARRAAFPKAWRAFDREKPRHAFLKALRRHCS